MKRFSALTTANPVARYARKSLLLLCGLFALLALTTTRTYATHAAGADISYKWISGTGTSTGSNTYEVTVSFYRFCSGVPAPTNVSISAKAAGYNLSVVLPKIPGTGQEITYPCGGATNCNTLGGILGIQQYKYRGNVTLPVGSNWTFSYQICCRNCEITTIQHPVPCNTSNTQPQLYVEAKLNSLVAPTNSSPSFSIYPVGFICAGQPFNFNQGAIDIDGDSLVYSLVAPKTSATTNVTYASGFSAANPITSSPAVNLNNANGQIVMNPTTVGEIGILAVWVREYRNGVLIGSTIRDMQFSIINCTNSNPVATGVNGSDDYTFHVCPGGTVNFTINTSDPDAGQNLTLEWNNAIPGATFNVVGQPPTGTFNWVTSAADAQTQPYTFVVTVRDNGCNYNNQQSYVFSIYVSDLNATTTVVNPTCNGLSNGSATAVAEGGVSPYTYIWSNAATTATISNLANGTYTVTITDANGCSGSATANVAAPNVLNASITVDQDILCAGTATGQATADVTGGTAPYTIVWDNGSTGASVTNLTAGAHSVTVTDANGCTTSANTTVAEFAPIIVAISSIQNVNCSGESTGAVDISVSGGTSPYTYLWSTGATTQDISNLAAGDYNLTVTDANGCTAATTATVGTGGISPLVTATITVTNINCFGDANGSATVSVAGGTAPFTYLWSTGGTDATVTGLSAGTITVSVTDANGCSDVDTADVTAPLVPFVATIDSITPISCNGSGNASVFLGVSGGTAPFTFVWDNTSTDQNLINVGPGLYTVTVTDTLGCTATATANVVEPATLIVDAVPVDTINYEVNCHGENSGAINAVVTGGTSPYSYNWADSTGTTISTNDFIAGLFAGTYFVTVTDAFGCSGIDSVTLTQPDTIVPLISSATVAGGANLLCFGDATASASVSVFGGTPPYNYFWNGVPGTDSIFNLPAGDLLFQVFDQNGCSATDTFTVTSPQEIVVFVNSTDATCAGGNTGSIEATVTGGTGAYTYAWSNGDTDAIITNLIEGIYTVTVTDENGCTAVSAPTIISAPVAMDVTATTVDPFCGGSSTGSIDLTVTGGTEPYTFAWSNGETTEDLTNLAAGTYTITVTDLNGCTATNSFILINQNPPITVSFVTTDVTCNGLFDGTAVATVIGGTAPYTFAWSNTNTSDTITGLAAGVYTITVTDSVGCTGSDVVVISEPATISATFVITNVAGCGSDTTGSIDMTVFGGTAPYTYTWVTEDTTEDVSNLPAGTYGVTIIDANNCAFFTEATIGSDAPIVVTIAATQPDCSTLVFGSASSTVTGGSGVFTYVWSNGETTANVANLPGGTYILTVTDDNGCTGQASISIDSCCAILDVTAITQTNPSCDETQLGVIQVVSSGGTAPYTYQWSDIAFGNSDSISGLSAGTYDVTVTDANGCTGENSFTLIPSALIVTGSQTPIDCEFGTLGTISVMASNGIAPYTYNWDSGSTDSTLIDLAGGTYTVTVTDVTGCTGVGSFTIVPGTLTVLIDGPIDCTILFPADLNAITIGGSGDFIYLWSDGQTDQVASVNTTGDYSVTVTDNLSGCTGTGTFSLQNSTLSVSILADTLSCGSTGALVDATISGGVGPYFYQWDNGEVTEDITADTAGTYCITVTDANNCTAEACATVTGSNALNVSFDLSDYGAGVNVTCVGNNGSITANPLNGIPTFTYNWSTGDTTQTVDSLGGGTYSVTITDNNGCSVDTTVTLVQSDTLILTPLTTNVTCAGDSNGVTSVTIAAGIAPYTYAWSNGGTDSTSTGLAAGTYTVTVTDVDGCTGQTTVTITEPVALVLDFIVNYCNVASTGGVTVSTLLTNGLPFSYNWSTGETTSSIVVATGADGLYSVTVTDFNGCTTSGDTNIVVPTALTVTLDSIQTPTCADSIGAAFISVTGGIAPYTFVWSTGTTDEDVANLTFGTYSVTVTDANGCTAMLDSAVTFLYPYVTMETNSSDPLCSGDSSGTAAVVALSGVPTVTFVWSNGDTGDNINGLSAGTYYVTGTDANGCTGLDSVIITDPLPIVGTITQTYFDVCGTNPTFQGTLVLNITGGIEPYIVSWDNGIVDTVTSSDTLINLPIGTYCATITDFNGCVGTSCQDIIQPADLTVDGAATNPSCGNATDGAIALSVAGGQSPYTFNWSNGATDGDLTGLGAGTYNVTVMDNDSCIATATFTLDSVGGLTVLIDQTSISCTDSITTLSAVVIGGSFPYTYVWSNGGTDDLIADAMVDSTYSVTVTDVNGCSGAETITVTTSSFTVSIDVVDTPSCGAADGMLMAMVSPEGVPPFTYTWDNGATDDIIPNIAAGTYCVTVTDATGCTASNCVTINSGTATFTVLADIIDVTGCFGDSTGCITLTVIGQTDPVTYQWSTGAADTTNSICNIPTGTYIVTVSDALGCTTLTYAITEPAPVNVNISITDSVTCANPTGCAMATATSGIAPFTYLWSNGTTDSLACGLAADSTYTVTVLDANGCSTTGTISLFQTPTFTLTFNVDSIFCNGESSGNIFVDVTGGTPGYTYFWNPSSADDPNFSNVSAGTYCVTVFDANGCSASDCVVVSEPEVLTAIATADTAGCGGAAIVSITGGTQPYLISWFDSLGTQLPIAGTVATGLQAGTYYITVSDGHGCVASDSVVVTTTAPSVSYTPIDPTCNGSANGSIQLTLGDSIAQEPFMIIWDNGATTQNISGLLAGTYCVTVTNNSGCTTSVCITLNNATAISFTAMSVDEIGCGETTGCVGIDTAAISGGTAPYTYIWSVNNATTAIVCGLATGTYSVTLTDANGCSATDTAFLAPPQSIIAILTPNPGCNGAQGSASADGSGGTFPYTFLWSPGGATTATITGLADGSYSVTVTDANGCSGSASTTISNLSDLGVSAGQNQDICGTTATLSATLGLANGGTWSLLSGAGVITSPNNATTGISGLQAGNNVFQFIGTNGACSDTATVTINSTNVTVNAGGDQSFCGTTTNLNATLATGTTGVWTSLDGATIADPTNPTTGVTIHQGINQFKWVVTFGNCKDSAIITITNAIPVATASDDITGQCLKFVDLVGTGGNGVWTVIGTATISSSTATAITVSGLDTPSTTILVWTVDNGGGCIADDSVTITNNTCDTTQVMHLDSIPNGFSPNGDGVNDNFYIGNIAKYPNNELTIFNRWGNVVYIKKNYNNEWNGTNTGGDPLPEGTYFVVFTSPDSGGIKYSGYVDMRRQ